MERLLGSSTKQELIRREQGALEESQAGSMAGPIYEEVGMGEKVRFFVLLARGYSGGIYPCL